MTTTNIARSSVNRLKNVVWDDDSPLSMTADTARGEIRTRYGKFNGGRADGVEIVQIDTGAAITHILPTRGMSLWEIQCGSVRFGWDSPVAGPVHPSLVPIDDPSGLGWLEGFDELVVRCGLQSNGAPEFSEQKQVIYPLHGRIGNLPADGLEIELDSGSGRLELIGELRESRLFFSNLHLRSRIRFQAGSSKIDILDDVTNESARPNSIQMLYHVNIGSPVLQQGSKLLLPIDELAPKDGLSAGEIDAFDQYDAPETGYSERVYFAKLRQDDSGQTAALLQNADASLGLGVSYSTKTLPRFIVWKNTAAIADGYVTGLEPATNYPNTRSYEQSQDRVVDLDPDETVAFRVSLQPLVDSGEVASLAQRIRSIAGDDPPTIHSSPRPGWSPGA